ncbi:transporter substrate-binding domain-containing protein, partial [Acinetobacter baumannii]|nr:transporter substrate-binding domain-containing protein [Acinetobacter baumannii]
VALVTNRSVAAQLTASSFDNEQVIKLISTGEEYAIAVSKDNPGLKDAINETLAKFSEDGTIDALMEKYSIK